MGGDGGSIPHRSEQVKVKAKREVLSREVIEAARWKHCAISQNPLRLPIVGCRMGNKETLLEYLLDRAKFTTNAAAHIKKLKDVKMLNLKQDKTAAKDDGPKQSSYLTFICPVLGLEMNGLHKFVFLWSCGCAFSKRALDNINDSHCLVCNKEFKPEDVILINPTDPLDVEKAKQRVALHSLASSKPKKRSADDSESAKSSTVTDEKKSKNVKDPQTDEEKFKNSTVYKSLFTTCDEAKNQEKAHWVTYNPLYFR
ncbi:Protein RTF2 [Cichlidogyrus casuarinus]|uniref:Replication termination factor 2 n=1 Tax=Cichlidogyrus casuarinus TaxID=1844966 RepID=A0ABD2Q7U4_9PLAT